MLLNDYNAEFMTNTIQTFNQISSLDALYIGLNTPLIDNEWGILILDLDQTLIQAKPTFGDEHFYQFLKQQNREHGINSDSHYEWASKIRAKIIYETCEPIEKINRILKDFREQGWVVKILTSRGMNMEAATKQHLEDSKLDLTLDDVIFKEMRTDGSGKLFQKDESFLNWMETQPQWKRYKQLRVLFPDDSDKYCSEVARIAYKVDKANVTCLHYIGSLPNPNLSEIQMKQLAVQLYAHQTNQPIPYTFNDLDLMIALDSLGIQNIGSEELYTTMLKIAENDNLPFKVL